MLIATSTTNNIFSQFGTVSSSVFSSLSAWLYLLVGIMVAWFMVESLLLIFGDIMERNDKLKEKQKNKK